MAASETAHRHSQQALLDAYSKLLVRVHHMHELANAEQWAELIEQRSNYVVLVEELRELDVTVVLDAQGKQRKSELLEQILEHDVEIRRRLVPALNAWSAVANGSAGRATLTGAVALAGGDAILP